MSIKKQLAVVAGVLAALWCGSAEAVTYYLRPVVTNASEFVWVGTNSDTFAGADVAAGKIVGVPNSTTECGHNLFTNAAPYGGVHYITNNLTVSNASVIIRGLNLKGGFNTNTYGTELAAGRVPVVQVGPAAGSGDEVIAIQGDGKCLISTGYRASKNYGDPDNDGRNNYTVVTNGANGGYAQFVINGYAAYSSWNANFGLWLEHLIISENATPRTGETTIDFLEVGKGGSEAGRAMLQEFRNRSSYPARILFNGGRLDLWYIGCGNSYSAIYADQNNSLIFESKNNNDIQIYKTAMTANLVAGPGTVKFVSSKNLRIMSNSYYSLKEYPDKSGIYVKNNFLPWYLPSSVGRVGQEGNFTTRIDWSEFTGDIHIGGTGSAAAGLQLRGNDQLPWGQGKGKVCLGLVSWNSSSKTLWTEISALMMDAGQTAHLNGIVNDGVYGYLCYLTNTYASTSSKYSTFILGDGDVDSDLSVNVTAKVAIEKVGSGTLYVSNTTFLADTKLTLSAGTTLFLGENNTLPEGDNFTIASGAEAIREIAINVASGVETNSTLFADDTNGVKVRIRKTGAGTLVLNNVANSFTGGLIVDGGAVESVQVDAVWNGSVDTATGTAGNWKNLETAPNFDKVYCGYRPVFGEGGSEAVFAAGINYLNGLKFNRTEDFKVSGSDATTVLKVVKPIEVESAADAESGHTYTIAAPLELQGATTTLTVGDNQTLKIAGGVAGETTVELKGKGTLTLTNTTFAGAINTANGSALRLQGDIGEEGDTNRISVECWGSGKAAYNTRLIFDNATVYKPMNICAGATNWCNVVPGSTNVFKGKFSIGHTASTTPTTALYLPANSQLVFEQGVCEGNDVGITGAKSKLNWHTINQCKNAEIVFNGPLHLPNSTSGIAGGEYGTDGARIIFNCTGNVCGTYFSLQYADIYFNVSNAFENTPYFYIGGGSSYAYFNHTRQEIPNFTASKQNSGKGYLHGLYPATLAITSGWANRDTAIAKPFCPINVFGWLKLEKSGDGYQTLGHPDGLVKSYASCGDIEVSGGTLEILTNTTWLCGTNFIVKGTGKLILTDDDTVQIGPQAVFHFADDGKVQITNGVSYLVKQIFVNGQEVGGGVYDDQTTEGPMAGRVTGGGKLRVKHGTIFIFR